MNFSFIYTVCSIITSFLINKIYAADKKYKIRKCLSLTKNECEIVLPSYEKNYTIRLI